jgi:hypothetical protein
LRKLETRLTKVAGRTFSGKENGERRKNEAGVRMKRHGMVKERNRWGESGGGKGTSEAWYSGKITERDPRDKMES